MEISKNKKQILIAVVCVGAGIFVGMVGMGLYGFAVESWGENMADVTHAEKSGEEMTLPDNPYIQKNDNERLIQEKRATSTHTLWSSIEQIRFKDITFTDKNHVLYPGTHRSVEARYFMGTYVPYNPSKLVYVRYVAKDMGVSFTCPDNWVFSSVLGYRLTVGILPDLFTWQYPGDSEDPRVHTSYQNDMGKASQFKIDRERIDRLGIESWDLFITSIASSASSEETVTIGGVPASKYVIPDSSGSGDHVMYFIKKDEYMYTITYETQINLTPEFDKILASIKFERE